MITALLIVIGIILLFLALKSFLLGNDLTLDQLKNLTNAMEDFVCHNTIMVSKTEKGNIFFEKDFVQAVKMQSIYLSGKCNGFVMLWSNGRRSNFVANTPEELAQLLIFSLLLKSGLERRKLTANDEEIKQVGDE